MAERRNVLTGIATTGMPHLGNYVGAIRPALEEARQEGVRAFYFLADYHALIKITDPVRVAQATHGVAATWMALGLDVERVFFYRQSDIPELLELYWLLSCVTAKGLLNRAHAYKAAVAANREQENRDADRGISLGLFAYPVLMAADILLFQAHRVPVGRDQVQHVEMARDIAARFNHLFGTRLVLPEAQLGEYTAVLQGMDGRKMSKSYDNTLPLFLPADALRKRIMKIRTTSQAPGEPKDADHCVLFSLYAALAEEQETLALRQEYREGIAWSEVKERLFAYLEEHFATARQRYESLIEDGAFLERTLRQGAERAREEARPFLGELREAVGLRSLGKNPPG